MDKERVSQVMLLVSSHLPQRDLCALLCVNTACRGVLLSHASLWKAINLQGKSQAGRRLLAALSLARYQDVEEINLEFGQDVQDEHLAAVKCKVWKFSCKLQRLNLNACQKITDAGVEAVVSECRSITKLEIYWNLKVTDAAVKSIVTNLKELELLNLSGCKSITDQSMRHLAEHSPSIRSLNLTRCVKLTDEGLCEILNVCLQLEELYLYALSGFTPKSLALIGNLEELKVLELTGAQELSSNCLVSISKCHKLESLCLSWCVRITDAGLKALTCPLKLLSLHGILGVTDEGLDALACYCSKTLHTLDVNGCINIKRRSREELLQRFPRLECFQVHS
ncbi:hypothetical protein SELMODRAFT_130925 [Selaginella moellendorffii]|uniref:F-box/LRR-repeat protein 15-like leucin rich repeat domain-containing protein n=1 Tax=Selaginella moellendorffii TaxID=88036 RepID=D8T2T6_SELML|nr:hypothetical protein SELMODRAFT_130925 [Selaginella moellendorffii]